MMSEPVSIIIPTYNEAENIRKIIPAIHEALVPHGVKPHVIVVDDDSPDRTWEEAGKLNGKYHVTSVRRQGERGLSSAVICGLRAAEADIVGFMDADFSHAPDQIINLLKPLMERRADLVIGSRYSGEGVITHWPWKRRLTSRVATLLASPFTTVKDPMSGFVFFRKKVVAQTSLNPLGFKLGLEIIAKGHYEKVLEVPITFKDRLHGESKLSGSVMVDYLKQLWQLFWEVDTALAQLVKFCLVGGLGVLVNMLVYSLALYRFGFHYLEAAVTSFSVAVISNFIFHRIWTFRSMQKHLAHSVSAQFGRFAVVSILGLLVNLGVLHLLIDFAHMHAVPAQLLAIAVATGINFLGTKKWVFVR